MNPGSKQIGSAQMNPGSKQMRVSGENVPKGAMVLQRYYDEEIGQGPYWTVDGARPDFSKYTLCGEYGCKDYETNGYELYLDFSFGCYGPDENLLATSRGSPGGMTVDVD